jgi:hypothetical protein
MLLESEELPPLKLCGDLMDLLTVGPQNQGHAYYDGNRLQLAWGYVRRLVETHPTVMVERLAEAAGSEYWKTVLDQLFTLPYHGEDDDTNSIVDALNLYCVSMNVLELLWDGWHNNKMDKNRTQQQQQQQRPLMIRHLDSFGGKAACKVAANAMAHVWVRHGKYLVGGQQPQQQQRGGSSNTIALRDVTYQLTQQLARIVTSWLQEFVPNHTDRLDILWNPMDAQLRDSAVPKKEQKDLKRHWVCSLDQTNTSSWELGPQLAKRVGIQKEYARLAENARDVGRLLGEAVASSEDQNAN